MVHLAVSAATGAVFFLQSTEIPRKVQLVAADKQITKRGHIGKCPKKFVIFGSDLLENPINNHCDGYKPEE